MTITNPDDMSIDQLMEENIYDHIGHILKSDLEALGIDRLLQQMTAAREPYDIAMAKAEIIKASQSRH